jgi:hypothetical protein
MPEISTYTDSSSISFPADGDALFHLPVFPAATDSMPFSAGKSLPASAGFPIVERSGKPLEANIVFLVFLCCLVMGSSVFVRSRRLIGLMFKNVFSTKSGQNISCETTNNDLFSKLILFVQVVVMTSIFLFTFFSHGKDTVGVQPENAMLCLGVFCLLFVSYFLYKLVSYYLIACIFSDKSTGAPWLKYWGSLVFLSGLVMFFPAMLIYFVPGLYYLNFSVVLLWFLITRIIIIYKTYMIFFNRINDLHYLFLYLCAQEIVPLFLMYKGMAYVFDIVVEKGILWI